eukprot:scaffold2038_cov259-Pinguiococcus_pyrenoidosus.AAC.5
MVDLRVQRGAGAGEEARSVRAAGLLAEAKIRPNGGAIDHVQVQLRRVSGPSVLHADLAFGLQGFPDLVAAVLHLQSEAQRFAASQRSVHPNTPIRLHLEAVQAHAGDLIATAHAQDVLVGQRRSKTREKRRFGAVS